MSGIGNPGAECPDFIEHEFNSCIKHQNHLLSPRAPLEIPSPIVRWLLSSLFSKDSQPKYQNSCAAKACRSVTTMTWSWCTCWEDDQRDRFFSEQLWTSKKREKDRENAGMQICPPFKKLWITILASKIYQSAPNTPKKIKKESSRNVDGSTVPCYSQGLGRKVESAFDQPMKMIHQRLNGDELGHWDCRTSRNSW